MKPFISAEQNIAELTLRSVLLAIVLTVILAISNTYLALKLGILTSASIPAAILSMGILRLFKRSTILENNAVQTAASAGEAVAGGIVYTIPALIVIEYWHHFDYLTNFFIALSGGILGVLFSIPLRRSLVHDQALKFPEGRAIAEVLKSSSEKIGMMDLVYGGIVGAILEFLQVGIKVLANSWNHWFVFKRSVFGLGAGFSATMIGAGYLIGFDMACSIFVGAIMSWLMAMPVLSHVFPDFLLQHPVNEAAMLLWNTQLRYLGIGAMLFAGIWTFIKLIRPLLNNVYLSLRGFTTKQVKDIQLRTDRDIGLPFILIGTALLSVLLFFFFRHIFPLELIGLGGVLSPGIVCGAVVYVLVIGFLFAVITSYFSGMVGVTASPGSAVVIAGILFASWLLLGLIHACVPLPLSKEQMVAAEAIIIIIASVVTGIAAIAIDNTQDLKVGQLVGATPWKQQLMLLLGVVVSSLVIPPVMQVLFNVYGIAGIMPHAGMDVSQSLPAPTAALLAAITEAVLHGSLPWMMMFSGAAIICVIIICNRAFKLQRYIQLSVLGVAIGMYLPITSSFPLFLGGMIPLFVNSRLRAKTQDESRIRQGKQTGTRIACGLVAGSALLDVLLAIPFSIYHSPDALSIVGANWENYGLILAVLSVLGLIRWMKVRICADWSRGSEK
jgi:putative OPT family oligopeptide transporter